MISFVILESYFFIILIANVLFIYLMCIRELENRKLLTLGLFARWFGVFYVRLKTSLHSVYLSELIIWDEAVPAFTQGLPFRNLYILQLPEQ